MYEEEIRSRVKIEKCDESASAFHIYRISRKPGHFFLFFAEYSCVAGAFNGKLFKPPADIVIHARDCQ